MSDHIESNVHPPINIQASAYTDQDPIESRAILSPPASGLQTLVQLPLASQTTFRITRRSLANTRLHEQASDTNTIQKTNNYHFDLRLK